MRKKSRNSCPVCVMRRLKTVETTDVSYSVSFLEAVELVGQRAEELSSSGRVLAGVLAVHGVVVEESRDLATDGGAVAGRSDLALV